jgi:hypothetical protein
MKTMRFGTIRKDNYIPLQKVIMASRVSDSLLPSYFKAPVNPLQRVSLFIATVVNTIINNYISLDRETCPLFADLLSNQYAFEEFVKRSRVNREMSFVIVRAPEAVFAIREGAVDPLMLLSEQETDSIEEKDSSDYSSNSNNNNNSQSHETKRKGIVFRKDNNIES